MILTVPMLWFVCVETWGILIINFLEVEPRFPRVLNSSWIFFFFWYQKIMMLLTFSIQNLQLSIKNDSFNYQNLVTFCHKTLSQCSIFAVGDNMQYSKQDIASYLASKILLFIPCSYSIMQDTMFAYCLHEVKMEILETVKMNCESGKGNRIFLATHRC